MYCDLSHMGHAGHETTQPLPLGSEGDVFRNIEEPVEECWMVLLVIAMLIVTCTTMAWQYNGMAALYHLKSTTCRHVHSHAHTLSTENYVMQSRAVSIKTP